MSFKARTPPKKVEFAKRMQSLLGSEAECQSFFEALEGLMESPRRSLRTNALRGVSLEALESFGLKNLQVIAWEKSGFFADFSQLEPLDTHPILGSGMIFLQEAGAMEVVPHLDPQPGENILDLCAAPGAKSTQIAERLKGEGWLVSNDPVRARAERLEALLARHGALNVSVFSQDPTQLAERFPYFFDRVLVDAPCSGESLFGKRKEKRWDVKDADVSGCARRQYLILHRAARMTKNSGRIVYSTCTYSREENEDLVAGFLAEHEGWQLLKEQRRYPHVDQVAGGYFAVLQAPDDWAENEAPNAEVIFMEPEHGAIRHGPFRWNGEVDTYALAMSAFPVEKIWEPFTVELRQSLPQKFENVELSLAEARQYLRGEALLRRSVAEKTEKLARWETFPLGPLRVLPDRMNNLLPKVLRGIS